MTSAHSPHVRQIWIMLIGLSRRERNSLLWRVMMLALAAPLALLGGRWALPGIGACVLSLLIPVVLSGFSWRRTLLDWPILLLVVTALMGVLVAPDASPAINRLAVLMLGIACYYALLAWPTPPDIVMGVPIGLMLLGMAVAIASLFVTDWSLGTLVAFPALYDRIPMLLRLSGSGVPYQDPTQVGVHPRVVAGALAMLLPVAIAIAWRANGRLLRGAALVSSFVMGSVLLLSQSPQGLLGVLLAVIAIYAWPRPVRLIWPMLLVGIFLGVWLTTHWWLPPAFVARIEFGITGRLAIWPSAILMIRDMSLTGVGLNSFSAVHAQYVLNPAPVPHAHNILLQTLLDQGVFGLLATVWMVLAVVFSTGFRRLSAYDRSIAAAVLGCACGVIGWLGYGMWDSMTMGYKAAPAWWAMVGVVASSQTLGVAKPVAVTRHPRRVVVGIASVLLVGVILSFPVLSSIARVNYGRLRWVRIESGTTVPRSADLHALIETADAAIASWPVNGRAYIFRGEIESQLGDDSSAIADLAQGLSLAGDDASAELALADAYHRSGNQAAAAEYWRRSGAKGVLQERALAARRAGDSEAALGWFSAMALTEPQDTGGLWGMSDLLATSGRGEEALALWEAYRARYPDQPGGYEGVAQILLSQQKAPAALAVAQEGLSRLGPSASLLAWQGEAMKASGSLENARSSFRSALELDPRSVHAWQSLGAVSEQLGDTAGALEAYLRAAESAPDGYWAWVSRQAAGRVALQRGQVDQGLGLLQSAARLSIEAGESPATSAQNWVIVGDAYRKVGDLTAALASYQKALELVPGFPAAAQGATAIQ
jgi:putative inorganic carbon (hco3(-)) transporter